MEWDQEEGRGAGRLERADWSIPRGCDKNRPVGYNPFRQQRRRSGDYVMVVAAFLVVTILLLWAALP